MHSSSRTPSNAPRRLSAKRTRSSRHRTTSYSSSAGESPAATAVEKKVRKLQSLIPGAEGMRPDELFLRTSDYILHLRFQLYVLQAISKAYSSTSSPTSPATAANCSSNDLDL